MNVKEILKLTQEVKIKPRATLEEAVINLTIQNETLKKALIELQLKLQDSKKWFNAKEFSNLDDELENVKA